MAGELELPEETEEREEPEEATELPPDDPPELPPDEPTDEALLDVGVMQQHVIISGSPAQPDVPVWHPPPVKVLQSFCDMHEAGGVQKILLVALPADEACGPVEDAAEEALEEEAPDAGRDEEELPPDVLDPCAEEEFAEDATEELAPEDGRDEDAPDDGRDEDVPDDRVEEPPGILLEEEPICPRRELDGIFSC